MTKREDSISKTKTKRAPPKAPVSAVAKKCQAPAVAEGTQTVAFPVFLHGLSLGQGNFRPAMIFKDKSEREVLPIWLDPIDANVMLAEAQNRGNRQAVVHRGSFKIFEAMKIRILSVYFDEVSGAIQYATVKLIQDSRETSVKMKASEAMSLAVNAGCVFYSDHKVVEGSRALTLEYLLHSERGPGMEKPDSLH